LGGRKQQSSSLWGECAEKQGWAGVGSCRAEWCALWPVFANCCSPVFLLDHLWINDDTAIQSYSGKAVGKQNSNPAHHDPSRYIPHLAVAGGLQEMGAL